MLLILVPVIFFGSSKQAKTQNLLDLSLSVYPGFTLVNFEKALEYSDDYMEDWSEFHLSASIRGFFRPEKPVQIGFGYPRWFSVAHRLFLSK